MPSVLQFPTFSIPSSKVGNAKIDVILKISEMRFVDDIVEISTPRVGINTKKDIPCHSVDEQEGAESNVWTTCVQRGVSDRDILFPIVPRPGSAGSNRPIEGPSCARRQCSCQNNQLPISRLLFFKTPGFHARGNVRITFWYPRPGCRRVLNINLLPEKIRMGVNECKKLVVAS